MYFLGVFLAVLVLLCLGLALLTGMGFVVDAIVFRIDDSLWVRLGRIALGLVMMALAIAILTALFK